MVENRWQMILGAAVLLLMILIATFSLGVYVGRHGLSRDGLRYDPGQTAGQPPKPGFTGDQAGMIGRPDLVGLVRECTETRLELATQDGPRSIALSQATKLFTSVGKPQPLSNLKPGDLVGVYGQIQNLDGNQFLAVRIILLPNRPQDPP
jgi:hypothetical protein